MSEEPRHTNLLADLAVEPALPVGEQLFVEEDQHVYISVGHTTPAIAARLSWLQRNVWMPDHVLSSLLDERGTIIPNPVAAAAVLLGNPMSVHQDRRLANAAYFIADATVLRNAGLLHSISTRYVDAVVESRLVGNRMILRLFHLSPRTRNYGGVQLWP